MSRGTGGLVTALTGLASYRDATWIASAMTDGDAERAAGGRRPPVHRASGRASGEYQVRWSSPTPTPTTASTTSSPTRCCGSSSTTSGTFQRPGHPPPRGRGVRVRLQRRQRGPRARRRRGDRRPGRAGRDGPRLPPLHAAGPRPARAARRLPAPLHPHPVDPVGRLARAAAPDPRGALQRAAGQRHHRLPHPGLPAQLPAVLPRPDGPRRRHGARHRALRRPRGLGARLPAADRRLGHPADRALRARAASSRRSCCAAGATT